MRTVTVLKQGKLSLQFFRANIDALTLVCSERKWKMKLKEWSFEKYLPAADLNIMIVKAEKRRREEGKETAFFHGNVQIKPEKFENFKKRKAAKDIDAESPNACNSVTIADSNLNIANTEY